MIRIPDEIKEQIINEAKGSYPRECCGFMLGSLIESASENYKSVLGIIPQENTSADSEQHHRFVIDPEAMMSVELRARRAGLDIVGFYHSHPDHGSVPSEYDRVHALPVYSYVIISVMSGSAESVESWELDASSKKFRKEIMEKWQ